jgi:hypothetical protein
MRVCSVEGCDRKHYAKSLCGPHYQQVRHFREAELAAIPKRAKYAGIQCSKSDCDKQAYGLGLCKPHYQREYRINHAEELSIHARTRRQRRQSALRIRHSKDDFLQRMAVWSNKCWMCGGPFECLDHVKPISKGGADCLANYRPACTSCNARKGSRWFGASELHRFIKT